MLVVRQQLVQVNLPEEAAGLPVHDMVFAREDGNPLALDAVTKRFGCTTCGTVRRR